MALHHIEEDLQKFEETERETQEQMQMLLLEAKEVEKRNEDREIIGESLVFRDNTMEQLQKG